MEKKKQTIIKLNIHKKYNDSWMKKLLQDYLHLTQIKFIISQILVIIATSFFALNRALLLKSVWRFVSEDGSLWYKVIHALYGPSVNSHRTHFSSNWCSILREVRKLKDKGFDFWSHCKKRVGNGINTSFWSDCCLGDIPLKGKYPRLFALELEKDATVASKLQFPLENSFHRSARGGIEQHLMMDLISTLDSISLSNSCDRWTCDLTSDREFRVKEVRNVIDNLFLPSQDIATRWVKYVPIKVNIFIGVPAKIVYRLGLT
jgi:hypothetical protein